MFVSSSFSLQFIVVVMTTVFVFQSACVTANNITIAAYFPTDASCSQTPAVPTTSVINGGCNSYNGSFYGVACVGSTATITVYQRGTGGCSGASLAGSGVGDGRTCILVTPTYDYFYAQVNCNNGTASLSSSSTGNGALSDRAAHSIQLIVPLAISIIGALALITL